MFYTIYKTTNLINGKFYIGKHQTKDINDGYLGSGKLLKRAVKKYGLENFHKEILHVCESEKQMNALEKILVVPDSELNYNLCDGGKGGFNYIYKNKLYVKAGWNHTQESKNKISLNHSDVSGEKNGMYGKESWCKGLTKYTDERLLESGKKQSIYRIKYWNSLNDEQKNKIIGDLSLAANKAKKDTKAATPMIGFPST